MENMRKIYSVLGVLFLVAGCVTTQSYEQMVGSGRLVMPEKSWTFFQKYRAEANAGAYAYNPRTGYSFYNYCAESQCVVSNVAEDAIAQCEAKSGSSCKLFAQGHKIVWRGPVYVGGEKVHDGELASAASAPIRLVAKFRFVGSSDHAEWRVGTLEIREEGLSDVFSAEFAKNIKCEGVFMGRQRFATSTKYFTSMRGRCWFGNGSEPYSIFTGSLNVIAKHKGNISGKDNQNRKTEIVF